MTNCHRYWGRNYFNESKITRLYYGEGNGTPLQYSCLENPMDGGAWKAAVHGLDAMRVGHDGAASLSFTFHFHALEREMATHSSTLAWRIPGTGEPGGLPSMGSHRVGYDWSDLAAAAAAVEVMEVQWSSFKPQKMMLWKCYTQYASKFGKAMATGLEKVSFHSNTKERQCQRMLKLPHNCTHLTR